MFGIIITTLYKFSREQISFPPPARMNSTISTRNRELTRPEDRLCCQGERSVRCYEPELDHSHVGKRARADEGTKKATASQGQI